MVRGTAAWSPALERALRWASQGHEGQIRKGSPVPYIEHPMAVAMILDRAGFDEDVVIAGLLHDLVEDTDATIERGPRSGSATVVAAIVGRLLGGQGGRLKVSNASLGRPKARPPPDGS